MKFKKEITLVIEGEIYDPSLSPDDLIQSIRWSWIHWWENNPKWPYGKPSEANQAAFLSKVYFKGKELKPGGQI